MEEPHPLLKPATNWKQNQRAHETSIWIFFISHYEWRLFLIYKIKCVIITLRAALDIFNMQHMIYNQILEPKDFPELIRNVNT